MIHPYRYRQDERADCREEKRKIAQRLIDGKLLALSMKISYDPKYDVMYIKFSEGMIADTNEVDANVLIDYGKDRKIIGIEILSASRMTMTDAF